MSCRLTYLISMLFEFKMSSCVAILFVVCMISFDWWAQTHGEAEPPVIL